MFAFAFPLISVRSPLIAKEDVFDRQTELGLYIFSPVGEHHALSAPNYKIVHV